MQMTTHSDNSNDIAAQEKSAKSTKVQYNNIR